MFLALPRIFYSPSLVHYFSPCVNNGNILFFFTLNLFYNSKKSSHDSFYFATVLRKKFGCNEGFDEYFSSTTPHKR